MRHTVTRTLFDHWNTLRGTRAAPERTEIDPRDISTVIAHTFIVETDASGMAPYRLAGSKVSALFGHEMKGLSFLGHFSGAERAEVERALADAADIASAVVLTASATTTTGRVLPLEILLLPVSHGGELGHRMIGTMAIVGDHAMPTRDAVIGLTLEAVRLEGSPSPLDTWTRLAHPLMAVAGGPAAAPNSRRPVLRVLQGGRV